MCLSTEGTDGRGSPRLATPRHAAGTSQQLPATRGTTEQDGNETSIGVRLPRPKRSADPAIFKHKRTLLNAAAVVYRPSPKVKSPVIRDAACKRR